MKRLPTIPTRGLLLTTALVALAACAGAVIVTGDRDIAAGYLPEELYVVATGKNELRTVIIGNPFDMPKSAFDAAVLASMKGRNFGPRLNLSTDPRQEDGRKRKVVIGFDLATRGNLNALCSGSADTTKLQQTAGKLAVTGVYCTGNNRYLIRATARADGVNGIDSEQFRKLMTQLAIALFPADNPKRRPSGRRRP